MSNSERKLSLADNTNEELYEKLKSQGVDQQEATRIANSHPTPLRIVDLHSDNYEAWGYEELYEKAQQLGIGDRSHMSKQELIKWLKVHKHQ